MGSVDKNENIQYYLIEKLFNKTITIIEKEENEKIFITGNIICSTVLYVFVC